MTPFLLALVGIVIVSFDAALGLSALRRARTERRLAAAVWRVHVEGPQGMMPRRPTSRPAGIVRPVAAAHLDVVEAVYAK